MEQLLHYILAHIVSNPDSIELETVTDGDMVTINIKVPEEDRGVIIGKGGMNIKSIRNLVSIIAKRDNKELYIKVLD